MTKPISHALVGAGGFGRQHVTTLLELMQKGRLRLAAVCEPSIRRLPEVAAELEVRKIPVYHDLEAMLAREVDLQSVTIATPIPLHEGMVRTCVARDLFVLLEKPPVPLLSQFDTLFAEIRADRVAVCFQLIEAEWCRTLKRLISEGSLGELREIRVAACWPRPDSYYERAPWAGRLVIDGRAVFDGPATNALSHLIHQMMFLASGVPGTFDVPVSVQGELYRARPIESYDTACLRGRFASGVTFQAAFSHASQEKLPYEILALGSKGWARVREDEESLETHQGPVALAPSDEFTRHYETFVDYASGLTSRPSTRLEDARGYLLAANGMLISCGRIHDIPAAYIQREEADGQYVIKDLIPGLAAFLRDGTLFSEMDFPWAVRTREVTQGELSRKIRAEDLLSFA